MLFSGYIVADNDSKSDNGLKIFLSRCNTSIYGNGNAIEFIEELGKRWNTRLSEKNDEINKVKLYTTPLQEDYINDSIFLSYASEDFEVAFKIYDALRDEGLDVWIDKQNLESGDIYEKKIEQNIKNSIFFIPIISKNTITYKRRFFQLEWNFAISEMRYRPASIPFILPLIIDKSVENDALIPEEFKKIHCSILISDNSMQEFVKNCKQKVRSIRLHKKN